MAAPQLSVVIQGQGVVNGDQFNTYQQTCDSIAQLRAFIGVIGIQVYVRGNNAIGDGGQGVFYWASGTGTDDGINVIVPTGALNGFWSRLSADFDVGVISTTASGTNAITLTITGAIPKPFVYANFQTYLFNAAQNSTGAVTVAVSAGGALLPSLPLFLPSGAQAGAGSIVQGTTYFVAFNQALNGGAGGFIILAPTVTQGPFSCTSSGTNAIALALTTGGAISAYANYQQFIFVAPANSTALVTVSVSGLAFLPLYQPGGSPQAGSGNITAGTLYVIAFNLALNSGTGGFVITSATPITQASGTIASRNLAINGGMDVDQANEGNSVSVSTGNSAYITDQTVVAFTGAATGITGQRTSITALPNFNRALTVTVGTGSATVNAGDSLVIYQNCEGIDTGALNFGTAVASTVSVGFWAISSVTGTFGLSLRNSAQNRSYVTTFGLTANVWSFVAIPNILGDTAGTWLSGAGQVGLQVTICLMSGTTAQASAGSWQAGNFLTTSAQTQLTQTTGATFSVTGLQPEPGAVNNGFIRDAYAVLLEKCQRKYYKTFAQGTLPAQNIGVNKGEFVWTANVSGAGSNNSPSFRFPVSMCKTPALTTFNPAAANAQARDISASADCSALATASITGDGFRLSTTTDGGATVNGLLGVHVVADARI